MVREYQDTAAKVAHVARKAVDDDDASCYDEAAVRSRAHELDIVRLACYLVALLLGASCQHACHACLAFGTRLPGALPASMTACR